MRSMLLAIGIFLSACGASVGASSALVGQTCTSSQDCNQTCHTGDSHYPGGMCTIRCASDADCPGGTSCVSEKDNICAVTCVNNNDCTAFGRGFVCDTRDRAGATGKALVCRVP